ncbi:hypothetical protein [Lactobacillus iners]|uniref:hypothetical protein n=2 Tax=Lactobacillus iners TaxID=147802 RepID=UPI001F0902F6|nr:hypothetical protein [Lactobacillus iners]MCT7676345.1 hypothetical protein [Lactobacillus iners]MCT7729440.1 hypothetical protein [Lactobacillus iners]MCT7844528.1 hypothetical protein [Lactobacillus iners]MCT7850184.1 hypothetical protein [Lactobacillus iners]
MEKEKWLGVWTLTSKEKKDGRHIKGEFKAGIIPSVALIALIIYPLLKLLFIINSTKTLYCSSTIDIKKYRIYSIIVQTHILFNGG